ncbi:MAG TPA: response regulator [Tenuifilaceae bacterium]|nr:response regulator [Tenuifilaceae bacterium]HRX31323.1 response regulator [Tenuifilaceae bacterium]
MNGKVNCIMLIDDNENDNFFHERVIKKNDAANRIIIKESGERALDYLKNQKQYGGPNPDIIFLDINMPRMNGWEFLDEYNKLDSELKGKMVVVMLTTSAREEDKNQAKALNILTDFKSKPLTKEMLEEVLVKYHEKQPSK